MAVLALLFPSCARLKASRSTLSALMVQRLNWMDEVAEAKRAKGLPTTDPKREAELLQAMTQRGVAAGLPAGCVRSFFSGQMQAAKVRQEEWLRQHPTATSGKVPDLTGTIRPALDEIGKKMIALLVQETRNTTYHARRSTIVSAQEQMTRAGYSQAVTKPALEGLTSALGSLFKGPVP